MGKARNRLSSRLEGTQERISGFQGLKLGKGLDNMIRRGRIAGDHTITCSTHMKRRVYTIIIAIIAIIMALGIVYVSWRALLWKSEALLYANAAGRMWAANDFDRRRVCQFRLLITDYPGIREPETKDGDFVIRTWVVYVNSPLESSNDPSIQAVRKLIEAYNSQMKNLVAHPDENAKARSIDEAHWQGIVKRLGRSNQVPENTVTNAPDSQH